MSQNKDKVCEQKYIIKFKSTNTAHQIIELNYQQNKSVLQYKQEIAQKLNDQSFNVKLIFKGKVLNDKQKAGLLNLKNNTVMMVLTKNKKSQKANLTSAEQTIPRNNLSTGLGSTSPIGFGGYGIMNHPQYMSAISSAVDEQKMQQIMNDPYYQGMMEQLLDDPQTLKQMLQQNPMTKQLMEQNPMMKMMMSNPQMMKMVFNKDTIKMVTQMKKNGTLPQANNTGLGLPTALNGISGFGGLGNLNNNNNNNNFGQYPNSNMLNNPLLSMMGSGFGNNLNNPNPNNNPTQQFGNLFSNPLFSNLLQNQSNNMNNQSQQNMNSFSLSQQIINNISQPINDELKYKNQIKQLDSMGFSNKDKCIKYLKQSQGDIDKALQKLCLDDDNSNQKQQQ